MTTIGRAEQKHGLGHGTNRAHSASSNYPFKLVTPTLSQRNRWSHRIGDSPYSTYSLSPASRLSARTTATAASTSDEGPVTPNDRDNPYIKSTVRRKAVPSFSAGGNPGLGLVGIDSSEDSARRGGFVESLGLAPIVVPRRSVESAPRSAPASISTASSTPSTSRSTPLPDRGTEDEPQAATHFAFKPTRPQPARPPSPSQSDLMSLTSVEPLLYHELASSTGEALLPHPRVVQSSPPRDLPRIWRQRDDDESSVRRVLRETDELNVERKAWQRRKKVTATRRKRSIDMLRSICVEKEPQRPVHLAEPKFLGRVPTFAERQAIEKPIRPPTLRKRSNSLESVHLRPVASTSTAVTQQRRASEAPASLSTIEAAREMQIKEDRWKRVLSTSVVRAPLEQQKPVLRQKSSDESRKTTASSQLGPSPDANNLFFKLPTTSESPLLVQRALDTTQGDEPLRYSAVTAPSPAFYRHNEGIRSEHATPEQTMKKRTFMPDLLIDRLVSEEAAQETLSRTIDASLAEAATDTSRTYTTGAESMTSGVWHTATEGGTPELSDWEQFDSLPLPSPPHSAASSPSRPTPRPVQGSTWAATSYAREYLGSLQSADLPTVDHETLEQPFVSKAKKRAEGLSFLEVSAVAPVSFLDLSPPITPNDSSLVAPTLASPGPLLSARDPRSRTSTGELSSVDGSAYDPSIMDGFPHPPSPWRRVAGASNSTTASVGRWPPSPLSATSHNYRAIVTSESADSIGAHDEADDTIRIGIHAA